MQVPAYWPIELGVQDEEKRGVLVEVKKVMDIESIPIIVPIAIPSDDELAVELAIDIPDMVLDGDPDIDIVIPDMDMPSILMF